MLKRLEVYYWEQILTATLIVLIAMIGLIGNSMIILAVSFSCKLHTSTNAFVTSLSITDFFTSFFMIFYTIGVLGKDRWPIPQAYWICELTGFMIYACTGTSLYTLAAIGVNRLVLILKPCIYPKIFTSWKLAICIAIPWVVPGGAFLISQLTGFGKFGYDPSDLACVPIDTPENDVSFSLGITLIGFPIPLFVIIVSYSWIYIFLRKHFQQKMKQTNLSSTPYTSTKITIPDTNLKQENTSSSESRKRPISHAQIKITQNLFLVVCSFLLCFLPYFTLIFIPNIHHVLFYTRVITLANSAINFAIYARKHPEFKVVLRHMMRCSYHDIPQPTRLLKLLLAHK